MTIHEHHLWGCAPTPLAWYLKALGILRLVAEQRDPEVRGGWCDEHFLLWTALDRAELERFFLEDYAPTPMVSPWNKGSGFMGSAGEPVSVLEVTTARRFERIRAGISESRALTASLVDADLEVRKIKDETKQKGMSAAERAELRGDPDYKRRLAQAERKFKALKADFIPSCRRSWRGAHLDWLEAALVVTEGDEAKFPSLLGTGGNDGRLDMTNNAMQRVGELFDLQGDAGGATPLGKTTLADALWGVPSPGRSDVAIGQFLPGSAGGANSANGPMGGAQVNRWDFLLALEGALAFRAHAVRRLGGSDPVLAAAPFAAYSHASGYGSASTADEGRRGEQWMPLWSRPASWAEVQALFAEGRAQVGRSAASRPIDLARAFTRLGVARGVTQFVRYGFIERNGRSNLAVVLDRIDVRDSPRARLIDDIAPWMNRLLRGARENSATARLQKAERRLSNAVFDALRQPEAAQHWQSVLLAAADAEKMLEAGTPPLAGPIPPLEAGWIEAANDGSPEFRLAVALGTARIPGERGRARSVREHFLPLEGGRLRTTGGKAPKLLADPSVVMNREPLDSLLALVERRLIAAESGARRRFDLVPTLGLGALLSDLALFIEGALDDRRIVALARAFAAVRLRGEERVAIPPALGERPEDAWLTLRVALLAKQLESGITVPADPAIVRRLRAGDGFGALQVALRRLGGAGLTSILHFGSTDPGLARRWGAALAFPLSFQTTERIVRSLFPSSQELIHDR